MNARVNQNYYDASGKCVTVVDIYDSWQKNEKTKAVAVIERPSGKASSMSLAVFLATYGQDVKEAN